MANFRLVPHNRPVIQKEIENYGEYASNDIEVDVLILYDKGLTTDSRGTKKDLDRELIKRVEKNTNERIKLRYSFNRPLAKLKSFILPDIDQTKTIRIIKDHAMLTDNQIGFLKGFVRTIEHDGKLCILGTAVITDNNAKMQFKNEMLREVSATLIGAEPFETIVEVSAVVNAAVEGCGFLMSDPINKDAIVLSEPIENRQIQLSEEIMQLSERATHLENVVLPNHILLSKAIKTGKIYPYQYDELINGDSAIIKKYIIDAKPGVDLGIMLGTSKPPSQIEFNQSSFENILKDTLNNIEKSKTSTTEESRPMEMIVEEKNFAEEARVNELKRILELSEASPHLVDKYIRCELDIEEEEARYTDKHYKTYLEELAQLRSSISTKHIQLQEFNNE